MRDQRAVTPRRNSDLPLASGALQLEFRVVPIGIVVAEFAETSLVKLPPRNSLRVPLPLAFSGDTGRVRISIEQKDLQCPATMSPQNQ